MAAEISVATIASALGNETSAEAVTLCWFGHGTMQRIKSRAAFQGFG